ncbi:MAG: ribosome-binding factor A, partial [Slackia piriformis]|nr:ribosome-binding factor A [Slackia piriformis]
SFDRSVCNVFYTTEPDRYEDVAAGFAAASGRIRTLMGKGLSWRVTPELRFLLDRSVDEAEKITDALARDAARNAESAEKSREAADAEAEGEE